MEGVFTRAELNLQTVYRDYLPMVYRVAFTYMRNSFDSEDAAQETFLRLARFRGSFEDERRLRAWLVVTASNICRDMLRRKHRQDANIEDYRDLAAPQESGGEVLEALRQLPDKFRTVTYLYYMEGYSVGEIAAALHQPEGTVKSWLHRARRQLKMSLGENDDD